MPINFKTILAIICTITLTLLITFFYLSSFETTKTKNNFTELPSKETLKPKPPENLNENVFCTADVKQCADGSYVSRIPPSCSFAMCPGVETKPTPTEPVACTMDAKMCPDGSYVGRTGPKCEFAPCP